MGRADQRAMILGLIHEMEDMHQSYVKALGGLDPYRSAKYENKQIADDLWEAACFAGASASQAREMLERFDKLPR